MKIDYIRASSWPGEFVITRRCSQCGSRIDNEKASFCVHCGRKFESRPKRMTGSKVAEILEAYYKGAK